MSLAGLVARARGLPAPAEAPRALAAPPPVMAGPFSFDVGAWIAFRVPGERAWRCHGCAPMDWPEDWDRDPTIAAMEYTTCPKLTS